MSFTKVKTDSDSLKKLKTIIEFNPALILNVDVIKKRIFVYDTKQSFIVLFFDKLWHQAEEYLRQEIKSRPDKSKRVEDWECIDQDENFSQEIKNSLLRLRSSFKNQHTRKNISVRKLNELADRHGVARSLGKIFLNEIVLDPSEENKKYVETAKILGLINE